MGSDDRFPCHFYHVPKGLFPHVRNVDHRPDLVHPAYDLPAEGREPLVRQLCFWIAFVFGRCRPAGAVIPGQRHIPDPAPVKVVQYPEVVPDRMTAFHSQHRNELPLLHQSLNIICGSGVSDLFWIPPNETVDGINLFVRLIEVGMGRLFRRYPDREHLDVEASLPEAGQIGLTMTGPDGNVLPRQDSLDYVVVRVDHNGFEMKLLVIYSRPEAEGECENYENGRESFHFGEYGKAGQAVDRHRRPVSEPPCGS